MRIRRGVLILCLLSSACAAKPQSAPKPEAVVAPPAAGPAAQECGPARMDQANAVRAAALDALMTQALKDANARQQTLGPIVLAEESRMGPGGQVVLHNTTPEIVEHFAGHTPPVDNYSSLFKVMNGHPVRDPRSVTFTTADICWREPTRVTVRARQLSAGVNRQYVATLEKKEAGWSVTALEPR